MDTPVLQALAILRVIPAVITVNIHRTRCRKWPNDDTLGLITDSAPSSKPPRVPSSLAATPPPRQHTTAQPTHHAIHPRPPPPPTTTQPIQARTPNIHHLVALHRVLVPQPRPTHPTHPLLQPSGTTPSASTLPYPPSHSPISAKSVLRQRLDSIPAPRLARNKDTTCYPTATSS